MYERLVVPTDGSTHAEAAADRAIDFANTLSATVHVLCVVETGPFGTVTVPGDSASAADVLTDRATEFVTRIEDRATARDVTVTTEVRQGIPVREILDYVDEIDADAIIMGTRGRGGINRMLLGSVTDGVIRHSDRDVLVVGPEDETAADELEPEA